jgi:3',5'-cyclic AMP phosphodiesterase CpdA
MKLLALSDLHLEFCDLQVPADASFDVAVLAGDIFCPGTAVVGWVQGQRALQRARAVILVPGNHEYYDRVMPDERAAMRRLCAESAAAGATPVHLLDCDSVVIDGVRFLGCTLWTDFELRIDTPEGPSSDVARGMAAARKCMVDYRTISVPLDARATAAHAPVGQTPEPGGQATRKLTAEDTLALHRAHRAWLAAALAEPFDGPTVVVTHHGPHRDSLAPAFAADWASTAFISELPPSFFEVPVLWIHGHTHTSFDYRVGSCRVLCNPRGYQRRNREVPENLRFDAGRVVGLG